MKDVDLEDEYAEVIAAERRHLKLQENEKVSGLALSGGGIRSASFALGVIQALVANKELEKMDYMSTVSGGGYLGSALTWALRDKSQDKEYDKKVDNVKAGTTADDFPLGKKGMAMRAHKKNPDENALNSKEKTGDTASDKQEKTVDTKSNNQRNTEAGDNPLLDFIRMHGNFLTPTPRLDILSFASVIVRSMLISLTVYFGMLVFLMCIFRGFNAFQTSMISGPLWDKFSVYIGPGFLIPGAVFLLIIYFVMGLVYSVRTYFSKGLASEYGQFIWIQEKDGLILKCAAAFLIIGLLPFIDEKLRCLGGNWTASISTLLGTAVTLWQYKKALSKDTSSGPISSLVIYFGAFCLIYGLLFLAYIVSDEFFEDHVKWGNIKWEWFFVLGVVTSILAWVTNLNYIGPHRVYRNRLMETFLPNSRAVEKNVWKAATESDDALLENMCDADYNPRPYHIINTNVILGNSPMVKYNGRGGDNFILSPLYCGSDATGWRTTRTFNKNGSRGMTLATAMAASGAAFNPDAALAGEGTTRNIVVSILLSILNLRLGYWVTNPRGQFKHFPPNFFIPGISSEIVKTGFKETSQLVQLSDGGHFENLALYELIRRKVNLIIVSDGGEDGKFNFDDLANAVEKARVDFGALIDFKEGSGLNLILPYKNEDNAFYEKYSIAKRGFAFADIRYIDGSRGTLVYLKLAMIDKLSTDVYSYKGVNPTFPHQSTADQFFDEKQFEAYRELGYYVTKQMMESEEWKKAITYLNAKIYELNYPEKDVLEAIEKFKGERPNYDPIISGETIDLEECPRNKKERYWNFHYFKIKGQIILTWTRSNGTRSTDFALVGIRDKGKSKDVDHHLDEIENKKLKHRFEELVIEPVKKILEERG